MLNVEQIKSEVGVIFSITEKRVWGKRDKERKVELLRESWFQAFQRFVLAEEAVRLLENVDDQHLPEMLEKALTIASRR